MILRRFALPLLLAAGLSAPAQAGDLFGGVYAHAVDTPLTKHTGEGGQDFELGYRFGSILSLGPLGALRPYAFVSANDRGDTSLAAAGLSLKFGGSIYVRPGLGVALHTGPSYRVGADGYRTDLGSRLLFEPELAVAVPVLPRLSLEASWVHVSHAQIFSRQNPGLDMIGARLNLAL
jgi:hypothetical protein